MYRLVMTAFHCNGSSVETKMFIHRPKCSPNGSFGNFSFFILTHSIKIYLDQAEKLEYISLSVLYLDFVVMYFI